uniref:winged helix-turn-helix domain-containing protein n=1 Tax=Streptomyces asoensis TaxID=249586 RepID=UPI00209C016B|nr:helix-turn-helix domain-containing protein [Streptomyces asoensis]
MSQEPGANEPPEAEHASAAPVELGDLAALRALAQPRRQRMLEHLTLHGPATSATLARALGLNTGSTSYHLRELARYGFVEETDAEKPAHRGEHPAEARRAEPSTHRERWWRAVPGDRRFPPRSRQSPEMRLVMDELNHHAYAADPDLFERLQRDAEDDDPWADAFPTFSIGMTGRAAPAVVPLVYATVVAGAGLLALVATAVPGRVALRVRAVTVATAQE